MTETILPAKEEHEKTGEAEEKRPRLSLVRKVF